VEHIKYSVASVVTYYEADVEITYRRTREQIASIVSATGTTAIRSELETALDSFASERVLRISYFDGDESYIRTLCQEAYDATPGAALDMPELSVSIYPDHGRQRIVEIQLSYHLDEQELEARKAALDQAAEELAGQLAVYTGDGLLTAAAQAVLSSGGYDPQGGSTAYHALLERGADSQGLALAMALMGQKLELSCQVVSGTWNDQPHFWTVVSTQEGWRHLDLARWTAWDAPFRSDAQMAEDGYDWNRDTVPKCGPSAEETALETGGAAAP
jgi:hypothetical protein